MRQDKLDFFLKYAEKNPVKFKEEMWQRITPLIGYCNANICSSCVHISGSCSLRLLELHEAEFLKLNYPEYFI